MEINHNWQETLAFGQSFRRLLHQHPELSWQEAQTARHIRTVLSELDIPWRVCAVNGTVAQLNPTGSGRHIALRADIDALPITEQSGAPWSSATPGVMHACGHDGHAAVLLATARWLKLNEKDLSGPVSLLFQPAEEGGHGARAMIEDGALQGIDVIYGWHNWPAIPFGQLACPEGAVMSGNATFSIQVQGAGGHASQPEKCRDPILASSAITLNLQQIVARLLPPQSSAVVSVTEFDAAGSLTVIPDTATLRGSIRFSDPQLKPQIENHIRRIADSTAESYGVSCQVEFQPRYAPTVNSAAAAKTAQNAWAELNGPASLLTAQPLPLMASEDFSYYLNEIPGAFAIIGAAQQPDGGESPPCHSAKYDFNDQLIAAVVRWYCLLVGIACPDEKSPA